jgi:integrase
MAVVRTQRGYQVRWYDADGRFRKRTYKGVTRDEAVRLEREILAARDRGERQPDVKSAPVFGAFATTWVEENRSGWKPSTLQQYQQVLKSQLRPAFAELRLANITESRVKQFVTQLRDGGLSARRTNLVVMVLKQIMRAARWRGWVRDDPLVEVRKLREPKTEVDPLSPDEVEAFLETCPAWWRPYFTVAFWTGARPNELAALKWGDVEWGLGTFRVRAGRYRGVESAPKTAGSVRDVDMLPQTKEALKGHRARQAAARLELGQGTQAAGQDYVFTGREGGLLNPNHLRDTVWYPTLTKAKLRRRTMYQTRHSFASNALAAGEAPSWVSRMLGHTSPEMLFEVYTRSIPNGPGGTAARSRVGWPGTGPTWGTPRASR